MLGSASGGRGVSWDQERYFVLMHVKMSIVPEYCGKRCRHLECTMLAWTFFKKLDELESVRIGEESWVLTIGNLEVLLRTAIWARLKQVQWAISRELSVCAWAIG